jgi:hypothetical protein
MTGVVKSAIVAVLCGFLAFFGITFLFLLLSMIVAYYDVTMEKLVKSTCESGACYYPTARTILEVCFILAVIVAVSIFVTVWRHRGKPSAHHFMDDLRRETEELKHEAERHRAKDDTQKT